MNQAFLQGNKRTGITSALMFLETNGYKWILNDHGDLAEWVLAMVVGRLSEMDLVERMRPYVR